MVKEGDFGEGEVSMLSQLVKSLEDAVMKLGEAYEKKNADEFNRAKKFIIQIQSKMLESLE